MAKVRFVTDENNVRYAITEELGEGGQGATYRTTDPVILIKMSFTNPAADPEQEYQKYRQEINEVRALPLTKEMHIAAPVFLLRKPVCGYVMQFMTNMTDLNDLVCGFLERESDQQIPYYLTSGGLYRRLRLLKNLSEIFYQLRQKNLVYSDLSYANVFVSKAEDAFEVWLIDADNIRFQGAVERSFGTPECMAPEVARGACNTIFSDIYSFALVAHVLLTGQKPFYGKLLKNGTRYDEESRMQTAAQEDNWVEDDWGVADSPDAAADCYQRAEWGMLPWIDDPDNPDNCSEGDGLRRCTVSPMLFSCFQQTFCYTGRKHPETRPTPLQWYRAFDQSLKQVIFCKQCGWSYYVSETCCPYCDTKRPSYYQAVITEYLFADDAPCTLLQPKEIKEQIVIRAEDADGTVLYCSDVQPLPFSVALREHEKAFVICYHSAERKWRVLQEGDFNCRVKIGENKYFSRKSSYFEADSLDNIVIAVPSYSDSKRIRKIQFQII